MLWRILYVKILKCLNRFKFRITCCVLLRKEVKWRIIGNLNSYEPENREIKHPEVVLDLLDAVIGDKRFGEIKDEIVNIKKEGRKVDMCEFLDKIENRGVEKGEETATLQIAKKLKEDDVDIEVIIKATGLTKEQIEAL